MITLIETEEPSLRTGKTNLKELSETIMKCAEDRTTKVKPVKDLIIEIIDEMEGKVKEEVYTTGLLKVDRALKGGMHKGEMMTVASETGCPSTYGFFFHTLLFFLVLWGLMLFPRD